LRKRERGQVGQHLRRHGGEQIGRPVAHAREQQRGQQDAVGQPEYGDALGHRRGCHPQAGAGKVQQAREQGI
jgi:hypothetical protein